MKRVILAMSGGVDSSVAAWLLREDGWDVHGVTFDFWRDGPASNAMEDAAKVCRTLEIPHRVVDCREEFLRRIVGPFQDEYFAGRTPNPCVRCNPLLKFGVLMKLADELQAEAVATGHYVHAGRLSEWRAGSSHSDSVEGLPDEQTGDRFALWKAVDPAKDQSYVLYGLSQEQLARCVFPLAGMKKGDVRSLAERLGLHTHNRPDSQEICFLPGNDYGAFLERTAPERIRPGPMLDMEGREVARHVGIHHFTIGQRKRLGVALGSPRYVVRIEPESAAVVIGCREDTLTKAFRVRDLNWVALPPPQKPFAARVKIRYTHTPRPATISPLDGGAAVRVEFEAAETAVTPGQSAVFYHDDLVLGGGTIGRAG